MRPAVHRNSIGEVTISGMTKDVKKCVEQRAERSHAFVVNGAMQHVLNVANKVCPMRSLSYGRQRRDQFGDRPSAVYVADRRRPTFRRRINATRKPTAVIYSRWLLVHPGRTRQLLLRHLMTIVSCGPNKPSVGLHSNCSPGCSTAC